MKNPTLANTFKLLAAHGKRGFYEVLTHVISSMLIFIVCVYEGSGGASDRGCGALARRTLDSRRP